MAPITSLRTRRPKARSARRLPMVKPLMVALVHAFPLIAMARPALYGPYVNGQIQTTAIVGRPGLPTLDGTNANVDTSQTSKGLLVINQKNQRAIYSWLNFDIDVNNSVVFNMAGTGYSALNRVTGVNPSYILGHLSATNGGEIFLVNRNGVLFGSSAVVNVGGLIASTLDVDDADFMSGLTNSLTSAKSTFFWNGADTGNGPITYDNPNNYVQVNKGAQITTTSGGRVFLLAKDVINDGSISTPDGQTVLAGGSDVYLVNPTGTNYTLYASESNDKITSLNGLLVEVNGSGSATNAVDGAISAARGNVTIVAQAVNNSGRLSATTAVNQNGSIYLLARTGTTAVTSGNSFLKQATQGGQLTLGANSVVEITPDASTATSDSNTTFTRSRVELSGQTIELQNNAQIVAHGGVVNVRAEDTPSYVADEAYVNASAVTPSSTARVVLGAGSMIDVSGTTDTTVSVARNFVTTSLLGAADLKDAPLQKDGPLYHKAVTFDVRSSSAILGDTSSYVNGIQKTAGEKLASGGTVSITTNGAVVMNNTATVNISGGQVSYTGAVVNPTTIVGTNGKIYNINNAPKDMTYLSVVGQASPTTTRWGIRKAATANQQGYLEAGYMSGQNAGTFKLVATTSEIGGSIKGSVVNGSRQLQGLDPLATAGVFEWGSRLSGATRYGPNDFSSGGTAGTFGSNSFGTAWMQDAEITSDAVSLSDAFWTDPLSADLGTTTSRISAATLNASGLGKMVFTADGSLVLQSNANLYLTDRASISFNAMGVNGVTLGASIVAKGGSVSAMTADPIALGLARDNGQGVGTITLAQGQSIDVSGDWVNQYLDAGAVRAALAGGSVSLKSAHGLDLESGSSIDVSGGGKVSTAGVVSGTAAGSIVLEGNNMVTNSAYALDAVVLDAQLSGYSMTKGASLRVKSGDVVIHAADGGPVMQSSGIADLNLSTAFFTQGGFQSYDIAGLSSVTLESGAVLAPRVVNWMVGANARKVVSGAHAGNALMLGSLADATRQPVTLSLSSSGYGEGVNGDLIIQAGAAIDADNAATVSLSAQRSLVMDGSIAAHGGQVNLTLSAVKAGVYTGLFEVGSTATIDVSGVRVSSPTNNGLLTGQVLAGGAINLTVADGNGSTTQLNVDSGAVLNADGATGVLDVPRALGGSGLATQRQTVASTGGSIAINANQGGAALDGTMQAHGGNAQTAGGSLTVALAHSTSSYTGPTSVLSLQSAVAQGASQAGGTTVSTQMLTAGGFADVTLSSQDRIEFGSDISYLAPRSLTLDAPTVASTGNYAVKLGGASFVALGNSRFSSSTDNTPAPAQVQGSLTLTGGLVDLFGVQSMQGVAAFNANSATEVRLRGVAGGSTDTPTGHLTTQGDVTFAAQQVVPTTATQYTLDAAGHTVTIAGGDANASAPLSAQSSLTINARRIVQDGVVRAPFGSITFNADQIDLGDKSLTSVSGAGLLVPYGSTLSGGKTWVYSGGGAPVTVTAPTAKSITLNAAGGSITSANGSKVDLSGGGDLAAYEFVAGNGGSKDIFAGNANGAFAIVPTVNGYAPSDAAILSLTDASGLTSSVKLGQQITFGNGGPIPAGTYAILPARYALLPGAFLVKPSTTNTSVALGYSARQTDGSVLVGGLLGSANTNFTSAQSAGFVVMTSAQAQRYSEVDVTYANQYFTNQATYNDNTVPSRPMDAGSFNVVAQTLSLPALSFLTPGAVDGVSVGARGGDLNISSNHILVNELPANTPGVLTLTAEQLNATGAQSILLGGSRSNGVMTVSASDVTINNGDHALTIADLIVAANEQVAVADNAQIKATGQTDGQALSVVGDGALLRVSANASATTTRTGQSQVAGDLNIGANTVLSGGGITAEATHSTQIQGSAKLNAQSIALGAAKVAVGNVPSSQIDSSTLVLNSGLSAQLAAAKNLSLRSFSSIDMYGQASVGGSSLQSVTLDAGTIALHDGATGQVSAGSVTLTNTTGTQGGASAGTGTLTVTADGSNGGDGHVSFGPGSVALSGASNAQVNAAGSVIFKGQTDTTVLSTAGDLQLNAQSVTATTAAQHQVVAGGAVTIAGAPSSSSVANVGAATAGVGAHLAVQADTIAQNGVVRLKSGELKLVAAGHAGADAVAFGGSSQTDLSGAAKTIDGVDIPSVGGTLSVQAASGNIRARAGSLIDVSAATTGGSAGSMSFAAPTGSVTLDGRLAATSTSGNTGGSLAIDSATKVDLAKLAATIAAGQSSALRNFVESISVRNRTGDQSVDAGTALSARKLTIEADAGTLNVAGTLKADASEGGTLTLAAGSDINVQSTAQLSAAATGANQNGGQVRVESTQGTITLASGSTVNTSATGTGTNGKLLLRAAQNAAHTDVKVNAGKVNLAGVKGVEVEAVRTYNASNVNSTLITTVTNDVSAFNTQASAIASRLSAGTGSVPVQVRDGVEIDSAVSSTNPSGDMTVAGNTTAGGWDLTALRSADGTPINLTLRAAGNLNVTGSLSDGFKSTTTKIAPTAAIQSGDGSTIRLVGGSDLSAANVLATQQLADGSNGDVIIGKSGSDVLVRTTTGDIQIAAGRDVKLTDPRAVVYTTGTPVAVTKLSDYKTPVKNLSNYVISTGQSFFLSGGGSVDVQAQRDIVGANAASGQQGADWWWRYKNSNNNNQLTWYNRYDKFREGFAAFGGGDITAQAGRDVVDVGLSTPTSGYNSSTGSGSATQFGGGSINLAAGRDVVGGFVFVGGANGSIAAGRDIAALDGSNTNSGLQVAYENTALNILARDNLFSSGVSMAGGLAASTEAGSALLYNFYIDGLSSKAAMNMVAVAGDLSYAEMHTNSSSASSAADSWRIPSVSLFAASNGSVTLGNIWSATGTADSALKILAAQDVTLNGVLVDQGYSANAAVVVATASNDGISSNVNDEAVLFGGEQYVGSIDSSDRSPLRISAEAGNISYLQTILSRKPLVMKAGLSILGNADASAIRIQQQSSTELSELIAGRDIIFPNTGGTSSVFSIEGPGNVLLAAGRNIDLSTAGGIAAYGNRNVGILPASSADLTLLAGVKLTGEDYQAAQARYFELLGGSGVGDFASDLYVQLLAERAGQALPGLASTDAANFAALSVSDQLARVRAVVGEAAYESAVRGYMSQRLHDAALTTSVALQAFDALSSGDQAGVVGKALSTAWISEVPQAQQVAQVLAMANQRGNPYTAALIAFVQLRTGTTSTVSHSSAQSLGSSSAASSNLSTADALALFNGLPVEQQLLFTNQVLISEVRASGREAAALSGSARDAAFERGYTAIATVFPDVATQTSSIDMGSSQIKTLQNSQVVTMTPDGGVNVGALTSGSAAKTSADLGIVTSDGGNISMIVRDDVTVNQSRVFSVGKGDLLMWSSEGSLDAGKGAKTITGAPPPVYYIGDDGKLHVDTSGSFSGSGIAVLDSTSALDLFTPKGVINTGDAGIVSKGAAYFGGTVIGPNLSLSGPSVGAPAPATIGNAATAMTPLAATSTSAGEKPAGDDSEEQKRRRRRSLVLEFLGFGSDGADLKN